MKIYTFNRGRFLKEIECKKYAPKKKGDGTCININKCEKSKIKKIDLCIVPRQWKKPDVPKKLVMEKIKYAKKQLAKLEYVCKITTDNLIRYFQTDTFYQDLDLSDILKNRWLVIHELVEIQEIKRMRIRITKKFGLKYNDRIDKAHIIATEMEIEAAGLSGDIEHIRKRFRNIKGWLDDPSTPSDDKKRIRILYLKVKQILKNAPS